jgi:hypothetical protein
MEAFGLGMLGGLAVSALFYSFARLRFKRALDAAVVRAKDELLRIEGLPNEARRRILESLNKH